MRDNNGWKPKNNASANRLEVTFGVLLNGRDFSYYNHNLSLKSAHDYEAAWKMERLGTGLPAKSNFILLKNRELTRYRMFVPGEVINGFLTHFLCSNPVLLRLWHQLLCDGPLPLDIYVLPQNRVTKNGW